MDDEYSVIVIIIIIICIYWISSPVYFRLGQRELLDSLK